MFVFFSPVNVFDIRESCRKICYCEETYLSAYFCLHVTSCITAVI